MEDKPLPPLRQYCEISTCMGITDCYLTKPVLGKIFWAILIILGLAVTLFQTYFTFTGYFYGNPFTASISQEGVDEGINFPKITICNFNRAKQSVINLTNLDTKVLSAMFQLLPVTYDIPLSYLDTNNFSTYENALTDYSTMVGDTDVRNFYRTYGHTAEEILMMGTFANGGALPAENLTEVFTVYGRCWQLDLKKPQMIPGEFAGAKLMLNPQLSEYMTNVVYNNYFQQGFIISIHYNDNPLMLNGITLAPGTSTDIILKATRNRFTDTQFPLKTKPCREDIKLTILKAGYTPTNCIYDCYMQSINKVCGCIMLVETNPNVETRVCNVTESILCANSRPTDQKQGTWWGDNIGSPILYCSKSCLLPCQDFMSIQASMSATKMDINNKTQTTEILKQIGFGKQWSEAYIKDAIENVVLAKIYFSTMDLAIIEIGETTPIMTFIGNVGGQLGLWMGISMFSIIQILYYFILGCVQGTFCGKKKEIQDVHQEKTTSETFQ